MLTAWQPPGLSAGSVDPDAKFKFVPAKGYIPLADEVRFDMFEAEFTHEADCCSMEVLLARTGIRDPGLVRISEIVGIVQ